MSLPKPVKCCPMGSYDCQVPMPLSGRLQSIDYCPKLGNDSHEKVLDRE